MNPALEAAQLIDSNIDPSDAPFILGEVGCGDEPILKTFPDAVLETCTELATKHSAVGPSMQALEEWHARAMSGTMTLRAMQNDAKSSLGVEVPFDWEACRTDEGYYRVTATLEHGVARLDCDAAGGRRNGRLLRHLVDGAPRKLEHGRSHLRFRR